MDIATFLEAAEYGNLSRVNDYIGHLGGLIRPPNDTPVITALYKAAEKGHVAIVQTIVTKWPRLNSCTDELGLRLLHVVARSGRCEVLEALPNRVQDMNVNARAKGNITPLHLAAYCGHVAMVELLLEWQDLDLLAVSDEKFTALHMASHAGHAGIVHILVAACSPSAVAALLNAVDCLGRTALHYACQNGHADVVGELVSYAGVTDPNVADLLLGLVPLHLAAWMGDHSELVKKLMSVPGIDWTARIGHSWNLLIADSATAYQKEVSSWDSLPRPRLRLNADGDRCSQATVTWKSEELSAEMRVPIGGCTALHLAAHENHSHVVRVLLEKLVGKADVNPLDKHGMTPLHYASAQGHVEVVRLLTQDPRVDVNASGKRPQRLWQRSHYPWHTPLHLAVRLERLEIVSELCAHRKVQATLRNWQGQTPLQMAWEKPVEVADALKEALLARGDVQRNQQRMKEVRETWLRSANALLVVGTIIFGLAFAIPPPPASSENDELEGSTRFGLSPAQPPQSSVLAALSAWRRKDHYTDSFRKSTTGTFFAALMGSAVALKAVLPPSLSAAELSVEVEVCRISRLVTISTMLVLLSSYCAANVYIEGQALTSRHIGVAPFDRAMFVGYALVSLPVAWEHSVHLHKIQVASIALPDPLVVRVNAERMTMFRSVVRSVVVYCPWLFLFYVFSVYLYFTIPRRW